MIVIKKGNILDCTNEIIVHQVNVQGSMGGGLARQIADKYPNTEEGYEKYCKQHNYDYEELTARVLVTDENNLLIANIFSQNTNFETDYLAMEKCFNGIRTLSRLTSKNIAIPYKLRLWNSKR